MKKILAVAFCLLIGTTVSAQEEEKVADQIQDAASEIVEAPVAESDIVAAPQEGEAPTPVEDSEMESEAPVEGQVIEGYAPPAAAAAPPAPGAVMEGSPCTGCGTAPVMSYSPYASYAPAAPAFTYAQATPCCGTTVAAAPAAPATYCCCPPAKRQRFRSRRAARRNPCCY